MREAIFGFLKPKIYAELLESRKRKYSFKFDGSDKNKKDIQSLLKHAKENSPYYRELLDSFDENVELKAVPLLTKANIKENRHTILSENKRDLLSAMENSTSGSTGEACHFYSDIRGGRDARAYRGDEYVKGYGFLNKQLIFWGAERDLLHKKSLKSFIHRYLYQQQTRSTYNLKTEDLYEYVEIINKYKPVTIVGYPSAMQIISKEVVNKSLQLTHTRRGFL